MLGVNLGTLIVMYMERNEFNELKCKVMDSWRYLVRVFESGIEDHDQFQTYTNMCQNYVDLCNGWCSRVKPMFGWLQYNQMKMYKDLYYTCAFTVSNVNELLATWNTMYEEAVEESKLKAQLEERLRFEHELALEFRDKQYDLDKEKSKTSPIGFKYQEPKKKRRKKKEE